MIQLINLQIWTISMRSEFDIVYVEHLEKFAVNIALRYSVTEEDLDVVNRGLKL